MAERAAHEALSPESDAAEVRELRVMKARRDGLSRVAPGESDQVEQLAAYIAAHCAGLPRRAGTIDHLVVYDGPAAVAEFEGGADASHEVARWLVMRATIEGKRIVHFVAPQCRHNENGEKLWEACRWKFASRPEADASVTADPSISAGSWGGNDALRLRDAHQHQLVQHLLTQSQQQTSGLREMVDACAAQMRAHGEVANGLLKQMARMVEALAHRAGTAETRAADATAEAREMGGSVIELHKELESAISTADQLRQELDKGTEHAVVTTATRELTQAALSLVGLSKEQLTAKTEAIAAAAAAAGAERASDENS